MPRTVLITGTGRPLGLGFNLARRFLENGDTVIATIRRPSEALEGLKKQYPDALHVLEMDIALSDSVNAAAQRAAQLVPCLDTIINNAVTASPDSAKVLPDYDPDLIAPVVNVGAAGPLRVIKAFLPLLRKSGTGALIVNISSEAGSIGACKRINNFDYAMAKAALNMATMTLHNYFADDPSVNIFCVHPGWIRTRPGDTQAPFDSYEHAEVLRKLFEAKRYDKTGPVFVIHTGEPYPW